MKATVFRMSILGVSILMLAAHGAVSAQEPQEGDAAAGMTAEMMAAWEQAASPGPEHEFLATMAGSWTLKGTFWMAPGAPPMESEGSSERTMIFDGRVLLEKMRSEWQGEPVEGMAMTGFDNVAGSYWGTWVDNMGTGLMVSSGTCSENSCEFTGTYNDPMIGGPKTVRMTMVTEGDREVHEMFEPGPDGEFKSMRLVYTRAK